MAYEKQVKPHDCLSKSKWGNQLIYALERKILFVFLMDAVIILVQEDYFFTSGYSIRVKSKRHVIKFRSFTAAFVILSGLFASFFFIIIFHIKHL